MTTRRLFGFLRVLFFVLTVLCLGARLVWTNAPHWVDRVDGWIIGTAHSGVRAQLAEATAQLKAGDHDEGLVELLRFEEATSDVRRGDRRTNNRMRGLTLLVEEYVRRGDPKQALRWSRTLHEFDPRYVPNEWVRADLLQQLGHGQEAAAVYQALERLGAQRPLDLPSNGPGQESSDG